MTTFYLRTPMEGTKMQRGQRIPWTLSEITFEPRGAGDDEPLQELLETGLKQFVKEDGSRPTREELAALKLWGAHAKSHFACSARGHLRRRMQRTDGGALGFSAGAEGTGEPDTGGRTQAGRF